LFSLSALLSLIPAAVVPWRHNRRDRVFWVLLAVAVAGPVAWSVVQVEAAWNASLSAALWVSVAATMALFAGLAAATEVGWRLTPLLLPYLTVLGGIATIWLHVPEPPSRIDAPPSWVSAHILAAVLTYALVNLAAIAGLAVFLQEQALKTKQPNRLTKLLPSVAEAESLQTRLLLASLAVLGLGLATGVSAFYVATGRLMAFDHKTVLSVASFVVIAGLVSAQRWTGLRGRRAARLALLAWLLLTLAYPGVKFVTAVLLGRSA
jgi:ABC-type uncharacterized transport system permease subunit